MYFCVLICQLYVSLNIFYVVFAVMFNSPRILRCHPHLEEAIQSSNVPQDAHTIAILAIIWASWAPFWVLWRVLKAFVATIGRVLKAFIAPRWPQEF